MARVQVTITGKAEKIWEKVSSSKSKVIEQAIIALAQDRKLAPIFFDDMEAIDAILEGKDIAPLPKKPKKKTIDSEEQVETAWG